MRKDQTRTPDRRSSIRVAIADNQTIFRKGMSSLLNETETVKVVSESNNGRELLLKVKKEEPDVILLDANMPVMCGIETTANLKKLHPEVKVLVLSAFNDRKQIIRLIKNGAHGFLLKDTSIENVLEGIYAVMNNGYYLNKMMSEAMFNVNKVPLSPSSKGILSIREIEIIKLLSQEMKNAEIADKLFINIRTVHRHRENIRIKINVKNVSGIVMYAIKNNLLD
ncbi:MAG: response regulator transcription factor [Bacteroidetes bacterium]|nr:response regulator transcription factor [Bacteroidota bacterium]